MQAQGTKSKRHDRESAQLNLSVIPYPYLKTTHYFQCLLECPELIYVYITTHTHTHTHTHRFFKT